LEIIAHFLELFSFTYYPPVWSTRILILQVALWFVAYIFVYSVICLPLFALLRGGAGRGAIARLAEWCTLPGVVYLLNVPNIVVGLWLGPHWPTTHNLVADWANFTGSMLTFLWGFVICGSAESLAMVERKRREFLVLALVMTVVFYAVPAHGALREVRNAYFGMGWLFSLVGYSRRYLNHGGPALRYATEAVYPFYIIHQTITVSVAYYMIHWQAPIGVKFPLLAAATFAGAWGFYELTRRNPVTRLLVGLKPRRATA
jgi:surface polysaccharide O-acyltransferase-like enzyme